MNTLADEITNDPLSRGYAGMTDEQVAESLNAANISINATVTKAKLLQWAGANQRIVKLKGGLASPNDDVENICEAALRLLSAADVTTFDTGDSANTAFLDALVAARVLEDADKTSLLELGEKTISRAEQLGIGTVRVGHVGEAR